MPKKSAFFLKFSSQISLKAEHQEDCLWGQTLLWIIKKLVTLSYTENLFSEDLLRPNITGTFGWMGYHGDVYSRRDAQTGAFFPDDNATYKYMNDGTHEGNLKWSVGFNASKSSSTFGRSGTVQPSALQLIPCIKF